MRRNLAASLFEHGAIRTTEPKAKDLRRFVEKLITTAKKGTLHARRQVISALTNQELFNSQGDSENQTVVQKLFNEIAPRYADRAGGYTRVIHLAERRIGDAGKQVILQLIEEGGEAAESVATSRRKKRATKRHDAAAATEAAAPAEVAVEAPVDEPEAEAVEEAPEAEASDDEPAEEEEKAD